MPPHREGESPEIELEDAHPQAPNVARVAVVLAFVEIRVDPLGAHVSDGPNRGVARIHGLLQDPAHAEVRDLDLLPHVDQEIGRLDVAMDDPTAVEVREPAEGLAGQIGEVLLSRDLQTLERAPVHELEQDLDLAVVVEHVVALDHVRVVHIAEDLDLAADLAPDRLLVVTVDHLQRVELPRRPVDHLIDRTAGAASDSAHALQLVEMDELDMVIAVVTVADAIASMVVVVLVGGSARGRRR